MILLDYAPKIEQGVRIWVEHNYQYPYPPEALENLVFNIILDRYEDIEKYEPTKSSALSWIQTRARYAAIDDLRKHNYPFIAPLPDHDHDPQISDPQGTADPGNSEISEEFLAIFEEGLVAVPKKQAQAIRHRYIDGRSDDQIAKDLGVSQVTVRTNVSRGLHKLKKELQKGDKLQRLKSLGFIISAFLLILLLLILLLTPFIVRKGPEAIAVTQNTPTIQRTVPKSSSLVVNPPIVASIGLSLPMLPARPERPIAEQLIISAPVPPASTTILSPSRLEASEPVIGRDAPTGTPPTPPAVAEIWTPAPVATSTATVVPAPTNTPRATSTPMRSVTPTVTPTSASTPINSPISTSKPTSTPDNTAVPTNTSEPTDVPTSISVPTNTPISRAVPAEPPDDTAVPTTILKPTYAATNTALPTVTLEPTNTPTSTPTNTATPTSTPMSMATPNPTCAPAQRRFVSVVLVIDRSGSMNGQKLQDAKEAALTFVEEMDLDHDEIGLVTFAAQARVDLPLSHNRNKIEAKINAITTDAETNIAAGVITATNEVLHHDDDTIPALIILSDGNETTGGSPQGAAEEAKANGIRIITIRLGEDANETVLRSMASSPQDYFEAISSEQLQAIYEEIAETIHPCQPPTDKPEETAVPTSTIEPTATPMQEANEPPAHADTPTETATPSEATVVSDETLTATATPVMLTPVALPISLNTSVSAGKI